MPTSVSGYIEAAPTDQRPALRELRALIREQLPHAEEQMSPNGFPVYTVGDDARWTAGFATRKKGPVLYVMRSDLVDEFEERLGSSRSGRSCIEWRAARHLTLDELRALATELLARAAE